MLLAQGAGQNLSVSGGVIGHVGKDLPKSLLQCNNYSIKMLSYIFLLFESYVSLAIKPFKTMAHPIADPLSPGINLEPRSKENFSNVGGMQVFMLSVCACMCTLHRIPLLTPC